MKRFWKDVAVEQDGDGCGIRLDGRPVRTPARAAGGTDVRARRGDRRRMAFGRGDGPREMPLTGLANAAIDRVAPAKDAFAEGIARYAEADLACYRAEGPRGLIERQEQSWDALLGWARRRFDVDFVTTSRPDASRSRRRRWSSWRTRSRHSTPTILQDCRRW